MDFFTTIYKRLVCASLILLSLVFPAADAVAGEWSAFGGDAPYLEATEALILDEDGMTLFARNAEVPMSMASITKVMTAVVALESGINLDASITVSNSVLYLDPESSVIGYVPGEIVSFAELIWGLLVHSGNDAALIISELIAGSEAAFVDMMNARAAQLGLYNTHFANPHGLDEYGHYSTAADLIKLGMHAMNIPLFASIVGCPSTTVTVNGAPVLFASTNEFLNLYPGMRGIKTGYTYGAGRAFLGVATRGGHTIYFCILGTSSNEARWADVQRLLDWSFSHYPEVILLYADDHLTKGLTFADRFGWSLASASNVWATYRLSPFVANNPVYLSAYHIAGSFAFPGDQVGQLIWRDSANEIVASRSLYASGSVINSAPSGPFVSNSFYGLDRF